MDRVNAARGQEGLGPLAHDEELAAIARRYSCRMGHRENMLGPRFTRTGVGACRAGRAIYFTQLFLRPPAR